MLAFARHASMYRSPRRLLVATIAGALCLTSSLQAQRAGAPARAGGGAWSLPEPTDLIDRVFTRIVAQDKPGAMPMTQFERRSVGRKETIDAVEEFAGHPVELSARAFSAVDGWKDARKLDVPPCEEAACPVTVNALWLAVTKIERGATPNVVHVWYATRFAANVGGTPQRQNYAFCERWVRTESGWKYEGFVKVVTLPERS